jgi:arylsulfatase A-like enzyme
VEGKSKQRAPVFIQYDGNGSLGNGQRCLVRGNDKLIVDTFKDEYFFELYDVKKDPMEKENLAFLPQNREKIEQLFTELQNIMKKTGDRLSFSKSSLQQFYTNYVNASNSKSANE